VAEKALATGKKKARKLGAKILFIDESGLTERPNKVRSWSKRGCTPVLQYSFNWKNLSATAAISSTNFWFKFYTGSIRSPQVIDFLQHLLNQVRGKLIILWDGLPAHRSKLVKEFLLKNSNRLTVERLPAYAPELNPVEFLWYYLKYQELPNYCPRDIDELKSEASRSMKAMKRRPKIIAAGWTQAELF
jgi:transposase